MKSSLILNVFLFAEELCNIWPGRIAKRYHYSFIPIWETAFIQWNTILTQRYYNTHEPVARNFFLSLSNTIINTENKSIRLTLKSSKTIRTRETCFVPNGARSWNANYQMLTTPTCMKRQRETAVKLLFPLKSSRATYYSTCKTVDQSLSRVIHLKSVSSNKSACKTSPRYGITVFKLETTYFAWICNPLVIISTLISIHSKHLIN